MFSRPRLAGVSSEHWPRGLVLSHEDEAPVGLLGEWLTEHRIRFDVCDVTGESLPPLAGYDFVASLGSAHSATDAGRAWVSDEIELLREAVAAKVPVLGLCFGGQALSIALGGEVRPAVRPQIGWFELAEGTGAIPAGPWFYWHFEQLSVPPGGEPLAHSDVGPAAFRHGRHLGLQFHPEVTVAAIASWARSDQKELAKLGISPEALRVESEQRAALAKAQAWELFELWWEELSGAAGTTQATSR
jgi:GMP synthase-like glutamine amidotransferase